MPYGNFVGYEPAEGGGLNFVTRDGKRLRMIGQAAEDMRQKLDLSDLTGASQTSPRSETTALSPDDEVKFRQWAKEHNVRDVDHPDSHYDYRGYWQESAAKKIQGGRDHFPDTYKQHAHPTFSVESRYSSGEDDGGHWDGDTYVPGSRAQFIPPEKPKLEPQYSPPEYVQPNMTPRTGWSLGEPTPPESEEPDHEKKKAALTAWLRGEDE